MADSQREDLYAVLGVPRDVEPDALKAAYRKLARVHHPDANPDDPSAGDERFKTISAAYAVLSDPARRKLYDEFGDLALDPQFDAKAAEQARMRSRARGGFSFEPGPGGGFGLGVEDWLGDLLFGRGGNHQSQSQSGWAPQGADLHSEVDIDFREAALGGTRRLSISRPAADGSARSEPLQVSIPVGVDDGARIRLAGKGAEAATGGPRGDLILTLRVRPDAVFRRAGRDLHMDVPLSVAEAVLGAEIEVPTLTGRAKLNVPSGTQGGAKLRLRGKGVPAARHQPAGDLYAHIRIHIPRELDDAARAAFEKLDDGGAAELRGKLLG